MVVHDRSTVVRCNVDGNGDFGIVANEHNFVLDTLMADNTNHGVQIQSGSIIRDCITRGNRNGIGSADSVLVSGCNSRANREHGISTFSGGLITNSIAFQNSGRGISRFTGQHALVSECVSVSNSSDGVFSDDGHVVDSLSEGHGTNYVLINGATLTDSH